MAHYILRQNLGGVPTLADSPFADLAEAQQALRDGEFDADDQIRVVGDAEDDASKANVDHPDFQRVGDHPDFGADAGGNGNGNYDGAGDAGGNDDGNAGNDDGNAGNDDGNAGNDDGAGADDAGAGSVMTQDGHDNSQNQNHQTVHLGGVVGEITNLVNQLVALFAAGAGRPVVAPAPAPAPAPPPRPRPDPEPAPEDQEEEEEEEEAPPPPARATAAWPPTRWPWWGWLLAISLGLLLGWLLWCFWPACPSCDQPEPKPPVVEQCCDGVTANAAINITVNDDGWGEVDYGCPFDDHAHCVAYIYADAGCVGGGTLDCRSSKFREEVEKQCAPCLSRR